MSPVKGKGSSYRKGKEIASDDLATKNVGEDAPHSESEHSDEEEGHRDPDNVCAPLINPWYNTYAHFLKVSGKCLPPSLGRIRLSICRRNTKVSWASLASSIPDLVIYQGTSLPVPILFEFGSGTFLGWKE